MPRLSLRLALALFTALPLPGLAQTLLTGDHSVDGKLCAGLSCTAAESFTATEALRLKGANVGIRFVDDDTTGSGIPNDDWEIRLGDAFVNGQEYFGVVDISTGRKVFHIGNSAPENAFFLAEDGDVGLGTSIPRSRLHVETTTTEGIRLSRSDIVGGAQVWESIIFDNGNYGIVDRATNFAPLQIKPLAPNAALFLNATRALFNVGQLDYDFVVRGEGRSNLIFADADTFRVGMGTPMPDAALHVEREDGTAEVLVENIGAGSGGARGMFTMRNNGGSFFTMDNSDNDTTWFFTHEDASPNRFIISDAVPDGPELSLTAEGDLTIQGQLFTAGSCAVGCDRVFDADYPLPTIPEQAAMMREKKHLPNVGPTPEDGPFNITAMTSGMLNELEKAHLYIAALDAENRALRARMEAFEARLAALETP